MTFIKPLPDSLINKIAAGEVVERPASVVKELVENSLDAQATQIDIEIQDGGRKAILVRDNGRGIAPDELKLAVSRHATSKINSVDDLFRIQTLGFRGEALASMASVSKMTVTSRLRGGDRGAREICIEDSQIISIDDAAHPEGTSVSIKYLFYQTPARLKFMKSAETEISHITDYVTRAALSNPTVTFRLNHNGNKLIQTPGNPDLKARLHDLFGSDVAKWVYPVAKGRDGFEVFGHVGHPMISRSNNRNLTLFVNGRPVRDKVLYHAVMEGYRDLLMKGRYPFVVLYLKVPHEMVDVNVHPAKTEVRFSNSSVVHRIVYEAVRETLVLEPWKEEGKKGMEGDARPSSGSYGSYTFPPPSSGNERPYADDNRLYGDLSRGFQRPHEPVTPSAAGSTSLFREDKETRQVEFGQNTFSELKVMGQLMGTYIVCELRETLILIDQHAAHERIGFERIRKQHEEGGIPSERLLIPENFDLSPSDAEIFKKYLDDLKTFGLEIDFFGGCTFVVKAIPVLFKNKITVKALVLDLIGDVLEKGKLTSLQDSLHEIFARMACHGAVRAHDRLSEEGMRSLLKEMDEFPFSSFCPHGRPVSIEVGRYEIEKWFKRIV